MEILVALLICQPPQAPQLPQYPALPSVSIGVSSSHLMCDNGRCRIGTVPTTPFATPFREVGCIPMAGHHSGGVAAVATSRPYPILQRFRRLR